MRRYCPTLSGRVAGGLDLEAVKNSTKLPMPCAYTVLAADEVDASTAENVVMQPLIDQVDVVVVLASQDERGQVAGDVIHDLRRELTGALVGWRPSDEHEPMQYAGGELLEINRAQVHYRFSFTAETQLGRSLPTDPPETWQEYELDGLSPLAWVDLEHDAIDPADPNLAPSGGPDGRPEANLTVELEQ